MSEKRKREDGAPVPDYRPGNKKKQKTGFRVGPANLPDGTYKRKTQKIKDGLIQRAKIKKDYAKVKKRGETRDKPEGIPTPASMQVEQPSPVKVVVETAVEVEEPTIDPHPDRQNLIEREAEAPAPPQAAESAPRAPVERRQRRPKAQPFQREHEQAQRQKAEAEERRRAREEADRQRHSKIEERERFRRAMAKARSGGVNGQRKLGRESKVLLERVQKLVAEGG
ncbi:hypothetical protein LTR91_002520 [Friedmanniomyces endolithicus]|uniref:rRNA-processing protein FYV7 n=1 Tax=Friedmanniomyces endolithicus TaxID=329885 RepID=A0AAN6KZ18_9PEZI|nr:hypothetical protein LTS00_014737 [Friedmanniomyces endolithicus]KAK0288144.1 hypothetical protein LTR35_003618 [Friedmanniomyces endolithicus]KAK0312114.1 hypothetical protein LTR01_003028 [Friedmanniomyces endolithicus]KAK0321730.1 hypothetical protein LTR82_007216 [Friedmanniomyces endolithicus]KAK0832348.1 hypothetical protein LTR73_002635 [Friedmanniomyces endolithicus]